MKRIFKKKSDLGCFFWPQGPLIEKSAAPQGSPPPTQQINIRSTNQLSWAINLPVGDEGAILGGAVGDVDGRWGRARARRGGRVHAATGLRGEKVLKNASAEKKNIETGK